MKRGLGLLVIGLFCATGLGQIRYFPQIGNGIAGTLEFRTSFIFVNTTLTDAAVQLDLFDEEGNPWPITLEPLGENTASFDFPLPSGHSISVETPGGGDLVTGYARFSANVEIGATAVFAGTDVPSGIVLFESGVAASQSLFEFSIFLDSLGNLDTGLALVSDPTVLTEGILEPGFELTLFDTAFNQIATTTVVLQPGQQVSKFIGEFFDGDPDAVAAAQEMQGSVAVSALGSPLAAVTLRQGLPPAPFPGGVITLTTFPVVPGIAVPVVVAAR